MNEVTIDTSGPNPYQKGTVFLIGMVLGSFISVAIGFVVPTFLLIVLVVFSVLIMAFASRSQVGETTGVSNVGLLILSMTLTMLLMRLVAENSPYLTKCIG